MFLIQMMLTLSPAWADIAPDPDCSELEDGDACFTDDGVDGTCDAGECVSSADDSGCSTLSATAAGGTTVLALGLLAVGRRREE